MPNYLTTNRAAWDDKVAVHLETEMYDMAGFTSGNTSLISIELERLGDLRGKRILHLQCHFGQDSISLARMGATVTGVDFSEVAVAQAKKMAAEEGASANFICCDLYALPQHLTEQFDIVFTSYGTIGWLPDLDKWAKVVSHFLRPNGKFIFVEFHPVVWMYDDKFTKIAYNYFNTGAIIEEYSGSYADLAAPITHTYTMWNHALSEVFNSLISNDLTINQFDEFDYSPYNCFQETVKIAPKKYQIAAFDNKIPMVYAIVATKK